MATTSITIMESIVMDNINDKKFYNSSAFRFALRALARIIDVQDQLEAEITRPLLRAAAINSGLAVLASAIPNVKELDIADSEEQPIWSCVVKIASGILEAGGARACSAADLPSQVQSDLTAFLTLRGLVTPALGFSSISKDTLRAYIESLFSNSLIHEPEPEEMPGPTKEILEDLYEIRMGRTYDPPASKRNQIGYACLDELFSLVARHDGSPQRVRLAQAASPFLIGRVAITLRGYIAPRSQRRELLYLLHKLLELRCEPSAIPNAPGAVSEDRRHLYRLLPLISHAIEVAWRDQELLIEFGRFTCNWSLRLVRLRPSIVAPGSDYGG
ncbi:MAG: hypothetical protein M1826_001100 [Phylliscum demangeonii]|nr:MAG: hypothetical protein M1826_001100 [Phylliscum demangeonii]